MVDKLILAPAEGEAMLTRVCVRVAELSLGSARLLWGSLQASRLLGFEPRAAYA